MRMIVAIGGLVLLVGVVVLAGACQSPCEQAEVLWEKHVRQSIHDGRMSALQRAEALSEVEGAKRRFPAACKKLEPVVDLGCFSVKSRSHQPDCEAQGTRLYKDLFPAAAP
jgi:hypothetical protein